MRSLILSVAVVLCLGVTNDASASAPSCRYSYPHGTVATADTVYDNTTKLTWQRKPSATPLAWEAAQAYCASLTRVGGFTSGWRLPTINELLSIVDFRAAAPAIDSTAFPGTPSTFFWTSTPYVYNGEHGKAWPVFFGAGYSNPAEVTQAYQVRCVR